MQYEQLRWIVFGCVSLFGLGLYYKGLSQQQKQYKQKLQEFEKVYKQSKIQKQKKLKDLMKNVEPKSQRIVCLQYLKPKYQPDTFKLYQRQISCFAPQTLYKSQKILEHQMGNEFEAITTLDQKLICRLDDFNLSTFLLKEQRKDVNLFKDINNLDAIVQSSTATLFSLFNVAVYGKLYYDNNRYEWILEPFFLTGAFELPKVVDRFYKQKIELNNLSKFAILLGGFVLGYFTIISPIVKWISKQRNRALQNQMGALSDIDYFKKKSHITVKGQSLLNCEKCRRKNVEIVYECGHLAICVDCHEKNTTKQCPLCTKVSTKFMKIYMA